MSQLKVKTRADASAQGKQRVFFCCHAQDHAAYFEPVSEEILHRQNCAVYYYEPGAAVEPRERELELGQMQLFVMPVTRQLLTETSDANQAMADFDFALGHHIPVLPLMQESGLEQLFNARCGSLQFLDKYAADPTAIGYEEKLTHYLDSVLVGDELAEKVRAAFDAYVFLSYRKKDRKYARELMQLIHKNDFCRDIAIWYDEFLTPGENFNEAIRAALEKSQLFALVVTPNLVNEPNYVAQVEYPLARQAGMRILPARMDDTDGDALQTMYEGIEQPTDARDRQALSQALLEKLAVIAKTENDTDPQHNFFIGLAYLNGIDVEIDYDRALALITSAAEAGLPEAMEKLITIYRLDRQAQDMQLEWHWMQRLADRRRELYRQTPDENGFFALRLALWNLGSLRNDTGEHEAAVALHREMLQLTQDFAPQLQPRQADGLIARCLTRLGETYGNKRDRDQALDCYQRACDILQRLLQEKATLPVRKDLGFTYRKLQELHDRYGDYAAAGHYAALSFAQYEAVAQESGSAEDRRWLARCCDARSSAARACKDYAAAEHWGLRRLEIEQELARENSSRATDLLALFEAYRWLGMNAQLLQSDMPKAAFYYERGIAYKEQVMATAKFPAFLCDELYQFTLFIGDECRDRGQTDWSEHWYQKAYDYLCRLAQWDDSPWRQEDRYKLCNRLASCALQKNDCARANAYFREGLDAARQWDAHRQNRESRRSLAMSYESVAQTAQQLGDWSGAAACYADELQVLERLTAEDGSNAWWLQQTEQALAAAQKQARKLSRRLRAWLKQKK